MVMFEPRMMRVKQDGRDLGREVEKDDKKKVRENQLEEGVRQVLQVKREAEDLKTQPYTRGGQKSNLYFDEKIIEVDDITDMNISVDPETVDLVDENFTSSEWNDLELLEQKYKEMTENYLHHCLEIKRDKLKLKNPEASDKDIPQSDSDTSFGELTSPFLS